jgi:hypothetical protein
MSRIVPGINKADTPSGAEGQWIDGDFVLDLDTDNQKK